ncbi:MAG: glycosyltransferase [Myxococcales bacterium]|nr:glycosyltransferase [Myxococcales bacterium]
MSVARVVRPRCSVLLPFRNVAETIAEAVESLLGDGLDPIEVIAIDDGSTDEGPSIVRAIALRDARVRLESTGGLGIVGALEFARTLVHPSSEYIARMDGDDVALPGRLRAQIAWLDARPSASLVATQVEAFPSEIVGDGLARYVAWQNAALSAEEHKRELFVEAPICHPSVVMRRDALEFVGGYRETRWAEDYDLWLRFDAAGCAIEKVPQCLLRWRQREGRLTWTHARYDAERFYEAKAQYLAPKIKSTRRPITVWGAGPTGRRSMRALEAHELRASRFVDIDPRKIGRVARGVAIEPPEALSPERDCVVVAVGARGARSLIRGRLDEWGFREGVDYWCVA